MWTSPSMVNSRLLILRQCVYEHNLIDPKEETPKEIQCIGGQLCLTLHSGNACKSETSTFFDYSVAQKKHVLVHSYILAQADCYIMFEVC